jgi:DNA-binding CsgD family transcriptional regulator
MSKLKKAILIKKMEKSIADSKGQAEQDLIERVKELTCLYGISELIDNSQDSMEKILDEAPHILPPCWQYPDTACARITFHEEEYTSSDFKVSEWGQFSAIEIENIQVGNVEVYYLEPKPLLDEGPFLYEERLLIDAIARMIGRAAQRIRSNRRLQNKQAALERSHAALKEVLETIEEKQREAISHIETNISKVIFPILFDIETQTFDEEVKVHIRLLKGYLEEITLPFSNMLMKKFSNLSPAEVQLCNLIRNNYSSKSIAKIRRVSPSTIYRQRESIRKKLGIKNEKVNLASYLSAYLPDQY